MIESIEEGIQRLPFDGTFFLDNVNYCSNAKLFERGSDALGADASHFGVARALFLKRRAFKHEREVRLVFVSDSGAKPGNLLRYFTDPKVLLEDIMLGPFQTEQDKVVVDRRMMNEARSILRARRSLIYAPGHGIQIRVGAI